MHLSRNAFDRLVEEAIASLPEEYARWIEEVPVIVEDRPGKADRDAVAGEDEDEPVGMFTGPSLGEGGDTSGGAGAPLPARVMIYRVPLMEGCHSRQHLAEEIRKTLIHELGHFAGMDEDELADHGFGDMEEDDDVEFEMDE